MKSDKVLIIYFLESELNKTYKKMFLNLDHSINEAIDDILSEIAQYMKVKDYVYNYYTEGKIYKALPKEGSTAQFIIESQEQEDKLKEIISDELINQIIIESIGAFKIPDDDDAAYKKYKIPSFSKKIKAKTRYLVMQNLMGDVSASVKIKTTKI